MNNSLVVTRLSPHPGASTHPSTFEVLRAKERVLTPYPFTVFTFGLIIESIQEFGGIIENLLMRAITLFRPHLNQKFAQEVMAL